MLKIPPHIEAVRDLIYNRFEHGALYMVGGCVRDSLLGYEPKDIDLATTYLPPFMLGLDGSTIRNYLIEALPIGIEFGTIVLIVTDMFGNGPSERVEITTLRRDIKCDGRHAEVNFTTDIDLDLERRDFTINAMAIELLRDGGLGPIIDPFNGKADLQNKILRAVGDPIQRFNEDRLRMVRACRFAGYGDGFTIEPNTWTAISQLKEMVPIDIARERIREELIKMMKTAYPSKCINSLKNTGLLEYVIPPLYNCVGVEQNRFHAETVYTHCVAVCDHLPADRPLLRLVGLLHDVGKPDTKEGDGPHCSFHNHEIKGARIAYNFMRDYLKFSNEDCEYASLMVRYHMFHFDLTSKKKTVKRWLRKVKGLHEDLFLLRMADRAGNKAKVGKPLETSFMKDLREKIKEIEEYQEPLSVADLSIGGKDLIEMGYTPGPKFGIVLRAILEKVDDDPLLNKDPKKLKELARELFKD